MRRAEKAERTRQAIVDAATDLFIDPGYSATTIQAIASRADVAVETVYKRFGSKSRLLSAILEPAIVGNSEGLDLLELPEVEEIRRCSDQRRQVRLLGHFSRSILDRTLTAHQILASAAATDPAARSVQAEDQERRHRTQSAFIGFLAANGPLRTGVSEATAVDTYGVLANPSTFELLTEQRGWSPDQYEQWLGDVLARLLLED
jgi:AcrR family transcriptional regulator